MIGSLISAGVGLASSIFGGIKARNAAKRQQEIIDNARQRNESIFNKEYYGDYMQSATAQSAMRNVRDYMKKSNERAANMAAVTGATPESVVAEKETASEAIADTAAAIQAQSDYQKQRALENYQAQEAALDNAAINQQQITEQGAAGFADAALQTGASIAQAALPSQNAYFSRNAIQKFGEDQARKAINRLNTNYTSVWNK